MTTLNEYMMQPLGDVLYNVYYLDIFMPHRDPDMIGEHVFSSVRQIMMRAGVHEGGCGLGLLNRGGYFGVYVPDRGNPEEDNGIAWFLQEVMK